MIAAEREPRSQTVRTVGVETDIAPHALLAVWRCSNCSIDRPRFD
jgi:hypothetical protein